MTEIIPKEKRSVAIMLGAFYGFCGVGIIDFIYATISYAKDGFEGFSLVLTVAFFYILIGLPIAIIVGLAIGYPLYLAAERESPIDLRKAVTIGSLMGVIFGFVNFLLFINAWPVWISILDLLSTIVVGALAGYLSFNFTKQPVTNLADFD